MTLDFRSHTVPFLFQMTKTIKRQKKKNISNTFKCESELKKKNNHGHFISRHTNGFHLCAPKHTHAPHGVELNRVGGVGMITWKTGSAALNGCIRKQMRVDTKQNGHR